MHIIRRTEQWRQRKDEDEDRRSGKTLQRRGRYDPDAAAENDSAGCGNANQRAHDIGPDGSFETACDSKQNERGGKLPDVQC